MSPAPRTADISAAQRFGYARYTSGHPEDAALREEKAS